MCAQVGQFEERVLTAVELLNVGFLKTLTCPPWTMSWHTLSEGQATLERPSATSWTLCQALTLSEPQFPLIIIIPSNDNNNKTTKKLWSCLEA